MAPPRRRCIMSFLILMMVVAVFLGRKGIMPIRSLTEQRGTTELLWFLTSRSGCGTRTHRFCLSVSLSVGVWRRHVSWRRSAMLPRFPLFHLRDQLPRNRERGLEKGRKMVIRNADLKKSPFHIRHSTCHSLRGVRTSASASNSLPFLLLT